MIKKEWDIGARRQRRGRRYGQVSGVGRRVEAVEGVETGEYSE